MKLEDEVFRRSWWDYRIRSSRGFRVRIVGPWSLEYRDALGSILITGEASVMRRPMGFHVDPASIPDTEQRPRANVIDDLRRAFKAAAWYFHDGSGDGP